MPGALTAAAIARCLCLRRAWPNTTGGRNGAALPRGAHPPRPNTAVTTAVRRHYSPGMETYTVVPHAGGYRVAAIEADGGQRVVQALPMEEAAIALLCRLQKSSCSVSDADAPANPLPPVPIHRQRRLSDHILIAFHFACDQGDFEAAYRVLAILQRMLRRLAPEGHPARRSDLEPSVGAHEQLRTLRHPEAGDQ